MDVSIVKMIQAFKRAQQLSLDDTTVSKESATVTNDDTVLQPVDRALNTYRGNKDDKDDKDDKADKPDKPDKDDASD